MGFISHFGLEYERSFDKFLYKIVIILHNFAQIKSSGNNEYENIQMERMNEFFKQYPVEML